MKLHGDGLMTEMWDHGGLTDEAARHIANIFQTREAILKYIEPMAQVLAEAGRASHKSLGDPPQKAVRKWAEVIVDRALEILKDDGPRRIEG